MDLTGVQWIKAGQAATARMHFCQLLHQSVKVWWPDDRKYYQGTVAEYMLDKVGSPCGENLACLGSERDICLPVCVHRGQCWQVGRMQQ